MRTLFVCRSLDNMAGGVERMITTVANAMSRRGHTVDLLTWDLADARSFYPLEPTVTWRKLDMGHPRALVHWKVKAARALPVRRIVRQGGYDDIVCFQDGPFFAIWAYTLGQGVPVIAAIRNAPTRFDHTSAGKRRHKIFRLLQRARYVLVQCESYRDMYPEYLRPRIRVIPNPVFPAGRFAAPGEPGPDGRCTLLTLGRLGHQKHYGVLVDAFARLAPDFPHWDMRIVGDGEEREELHAQVEAAGLAGRISLDMPVSDVESLYVSSHLFCLSSRWEGFPNALAEALAHGLPAVGFADCAGVNELILDGENGFLAPGNGEPGTLAETLAKAMQDDAGRAAMGKAAVRSVERYEPERMFDLWEKAISMEL